MAGIQKATPRLRSVQIAALAMLVMAGVINYIDRATLAVANPLIREELGLSIADMGYLLSAFLWAYAFSQLPTGAMVDKVGPRILLALGLSLWSLAQLLGGLVQGSASFSARGFCSGLAKHRNSRPARAWCGTGSINGTGVSPPASSTARRRWVRRLPFRC
jgi:sugar phosphate permease